MFSEQFTAFIILSSNGTGGDGLGYNDAFIGKHKHLRGLRRNSIQNLFKSIIKNGKAVRTGIKIINRNKGFVDSGESSVVDDLFIDFFQTVTGNLVEDKFALVA